MLHLNRSNYLAYGNQTYGGVALKNADTNVWNSIVAFFAPGAFDEEVLMTPGVVTNGTYRGVGAFLLSFSSLQSLVGGLNGGIGWQFPPTTFQAANGGNINVFRNPDGSVTDYGLQTSPNNNNSSYLVNAAPPSWQDAAVAPPMAGGHGPSA